MAKWEKDKMLESARRCTALVLAAAFGIPAAAQDAERMEVLAAPCASCHGTDGSSPGAIPSLDTLDSESFAALFRGYRSGEVEGTVMNRIARGYSDAEVDALIQYFQTLQR